MHYGVPSGLSSTLQLLFCAPIVSCSVVVKNGEGGELTPRLCTHLSLTCTAPDPLLFESSIICISSLASAGK
uniref:Secreted protein n=1 Tax=Anguilla anguilla TaxID=7936 RepID=A0A0E9RJM9_ANGAN